MKKTTLFLLMAFFVIQSYAQTARFILDNGKISSCQIMNKDKKQIIAESEDGILDYTGLIDSISFKANDLNKITKHKFAVGGIPLIFVNKSGDGITGRYEIGLPVGKRDIDNKIKKTSITLKNNDIISVFRVEDDKAEKSIGNIRIIKDTLEQDCVAKKITIQKVSPYNKYTFRNKDSISFTVKLVIDNIELSNIRVNYDGINRPVKLEDDSLSYTIDPSSLQEGKNYPVSLVFNVIGENKRDFTKTIASVEVSQSNSCLSIVIIAVVFLGFLIWFLIYFFKRRNKIECKRFQDVNGLDFYIKSDKKPQIGDSASPDGIYERENGYVYEILRKKIGSIKLKLKDVENKEFMVTLINNKPQIGDIATPKGRYIMTDGTVYKVSSQNIIVTIISPDDYINLPTVDGKILMIVCSKSDIPSVGNEVLSSDGKYEMQDGAIYNIEDSKIISIKKQRYKIIEELELNLSSANERIQELLKRPTKEAYDALRECFSDTNQKLEKAEETLKDVNASIKEAEKIARIDERQKTELKHKRELCEKYLSIDSHKAGIKKIEAEREFATKAKEKLEKEVKVKDTSLFEAETKIKEQSVEIRTKKEENIRLKALNAQLKEVAYKKNLYYLLEVEETLAVINNDFKGVYKDMSNDIVKDGFINPMLKGVGGLSTGILSWREDFTANVQENLEGFFGQEFFTMKEENVKEVLAKKFISNIVKSDSFSKFVRLYHLSTVPFIHRQFLEAGMNLELLNKLYYKIYTLITDFRYTIICPRLFEEQLDEQKYQWFSNTNIFNILTFTDETKAEIKKKGAMIIIDVNQIGYSSPWISRKATAVTPDF